mmetsp:Transcript_128627/g.274464  ORF Transcript_128627/g.274464 Transcript_128627/m.274464 type:complete len:412 (+) Transcript_128627:1637-2872(+)
MVVQAHGEVILDEVLPRDSEVHGVPEPELFAHLLQSLCGDLAAFRHGTLKHDEVPYFWRQVPRLDAIATRLRPIQIALEKMGHRVVRHVNGAVRQGFYDELLVPGHPSAETERSATGPLLQPTDGIHEGVLDTVIIGAEVGALQVLLDLGPPALFAVLQVPLVDARHHTLVPTPGHNLVLWLMVNEGLPGFHHDRPEVQLGLLHRLPLARTIGHGALVEAKLVAHIVRLLELLLVLLGLDVELLAHVLCSHVAHLAIDFHIDDGDQLERLDPFRLDTEVLPLAGLHQVHEGRVVIWGVAGDTGDNACSLVHLDGKQRQHIDGVVLAGRRLHFGPQEFLPCHLEQALRLSPRHEDVLEAHVARSPVRADVHSVATLRLEAAISAFWQDPGVGLAGHRLSTQRGRQHVDLLPF